MISTIVDIGFNLMWLGWLLTVLIAVWALPVLLVLLITGKIK